MIKAAKLITSEHIIGQFKVFNNGGINSYIVTNPYIIEFYEVSTTDDLQFLSETPKEDIKVTNHVYFEKWIPYSKDNFFIVDYEMIVTFYEPLDEIKDSYIKKFGDN